MDASSPAAALRTAQPTRRYAFYVLALLLAAQAISYADRHLFSVLIPAMKAEFGLSDATIGLIGGPAFSVSFVLLSLPLARLADRRSHRGVLAASVALWSTATALCGLAANAVHLTLGRVLVGVGEAGGMPPSQAMIADLFEERRRSSALGVLTSGTCLGIMLGLAGGGAIAAAYGWRAAFFLLAALGIPIALLIQFTAPRRAAAASAAPPGDSVWVMLRYCWSIRSFRLLTIGMGLFNMFGYAGAIWLPAYFMRSHGMTIVEAGTWLGVGSAIGGIAGSIASGAIVDALPPRDERWQLRVPGIAFLTAFPLLLLMLLVPGGSRVDLGGTAVPTVALISLATGFLSALWAGPLFGAASRLVEPHRRAQAVAVLVIVTNTMGSAIGPVVAGFVSDGLTAAFGKEALRYSLLSMSILVVVGGMLFLRAAAHYPADLRR